MGLESTILRTLVTLGASNPRSFQQSSLSRPRVHDPSKSRHFLGIQSTILRTVVTFGPRVHDPYNCRHFLGLHFTILVILVHPPILHLLIIARHYPGFRDFRGSEDSGIPVARGFPRFPGFRDSGVTGNCNFFLKIGRFIRGLVPVCPGVA